jgi:hypothetical protein
VSSNDPLLVNLAQLPQAHSIIHTFHNHIRNKKNELLRQHASAFPQYKYFPPCIDSGVNKRRIEGPTNHHESHLPPMLPYFFATPDVHIPASLHRPQPPPFTFQNQISLPEGELVSNIGLGIEWGKMSMKEFDLLGELGM